MVTIIVLYRNLVSYCLEPQLLLLPILPPKRLDLAPSSFHSSIRFSRQTQQVILIQKLVGKSKDVGAAYLFRIALRLLLRRGWRALVPRRRVARSVWWCRRLVNRVRGYVRVCREVGEAAGPEEGDKVGLDFK